MQFNNFARMISKLLIVEKAPTKLSYSICLTSIRTIYIIALQTED